MDTITIRRFESGDTNPLVAIWQDASARAHGFLPEALLVEQAVAVRDIYLPEAETWVAVGDRPLGFIGLLDNHIGGLFVSPATQGQGIGAQLVTHAQGIHGTLTVEVYEENPQAVGFYRRMGFAPVLRRETDDNGLPHPLLRMQLG